MPINTPGVNVEDNGTPLGRFQTFDFQSNITATPAGDTAEIDATGGGGGSVPVEDEGVEITAAVTSFDFVGAGVLATAAGDDVTITIPGAVPGLLASRPAAAAANEGMVWYATDVDLFYISDGSTWTTAVLDHGTALTGLSDDDHPQYAQKANNLSDLTDASDGKTNLQVGYATRSFARVNFR